MYDPWQHYYIILKEEFYGKYLLPTQEWDISMDNKLYQLYRDPTLMQEMTKVHNYRVWAILKEKKQSGHQRKSSLVPLDDQDEGG